MFDDDRMPSIWDLDDSTRSYLAANSEERKQMNNDADSLFTMIIVTIVAFFGVCWLINKLGLM